MTKKYMATIFRPEIKLVAIQKETEKCVFMRGDRYSKISEYTGFFDSEAEAIDYLMKDALNKIEDAEKQLIFSKNHLEKIDKIKNELA